VSKTKELVCHRTCINNFGASMAVSGIAQVDSDKLSGIIFNANLNFQQQDELTVKVCSQ